ncbi:MAG: GNAT family N-acetyltransferase [Candidatus Marinimicrobia bacterium]|nr:GNAT family N-acetyltransferase [Candidatus Neomarinimicrobiota bacterium]
MIETQVTFHSWKDNKAVEIIKYILEVFVKEQKVPLEEEIDAYDPQSIHVFLQVKDTEGNYYPAGIGQLLPNGHIGRIAGLKRYRKHGFSHLMMETLKTKAEEFGFFSIELYAQLQLIPFYEKIGYTTYRDVFMDAGIPHKKMRKT